MFQYKRKTSFKKLDSEFFHLAKKIEELKLPKDFSQFILYTFSELFANIKEHSRAKKITFQFQINKNCVIEVEDDGIGLRNSYLSKKIFPKDDISAIEFALSGLSVKSPTERGFGLYTIKKLTEALNGEMQIKSGSAMAFVKRNKIIFRKLLPRKKGVTVKVKTKIKEFDFYKIIK